MSCGTLLTLNFFIQILLLLINCVVLVFIGKCVFIFYKYRSFIKNISSNNHIFDIFTRTQSNASTNSFVNFGNSVAENNSKQQVMPLVLPNISTKETLDVCDILNKSKSFFSSTQPVNIENLRDKSSDIEINSPDSVSDPLSNNSVKNNADHANDMNDADDIVRKFNAVKLRVGRKKKRTKNSLDAISEFEKLRSQMSESLKKIDNVQEVDMTDLKERFATDLTKFLQDSNIIK